MERFDLSLISDGDPEELEAAYGASWENPEDVWDVPEEDPNALPPQGWLDERPTLCPRTGAVLKNRANTINVYESRRRLPEELKGRKNIYKAPCAVCGYAHGYGFITNTVSSGKVVKPALCRRHRLTLRTKGLFTGYNPRDPLNAGNYSKVMGHMNSVLLQGLLFDTMRGPTKARAWLEADRRFKDIIESGKLSFVSDAFLRKRWGEYKRKELWGPWLYRHSLVGHPRGPRFLLRNGWDDKRPRYDTAFIVHHYFRTAWAFHTAPEDTWRVHDLYPPWHKKAKNLAVCRGMRGNFGRTIVLNRIDEPFIFETQGGPEWNGKPVEETPERSWKMDPVVLQYLGREIHKIMNSVFSPYLEGEDLWSHLELLTKTRLVNHPDYVTYERSKELKKHLNGLCKNCPYDRPWTGLVPRPWMDEDLYSPRFPSKWAMVPHRVRDNLWPQNFSDLMALERGSF